MREYYEREALNYSTLAAMDSYNPGSAFDDDSYREMSIAMIKGSLVDCLLTSPDEYDSLFEIQEEISLTKSISDIIDKLVEMNMEYTDSNILFIAEEMNYGGKNWKNDTILKNLKTEDSRRYYDRKKLNNTKTIITQELYDKAAIVVETLKNHEFSRWIFEENNNVEVLYQVPIYWNDGKNDCKALLDILIIDHEHRLIYPIDLKTKSESVYSFSKSFIRFKYYLQAAWYTKAVKYIRDEKYPSYNIENFRFLVTSFEYPDPPIIYVCDDITLDVGLYGGILTNGEQVKGVIELQNDFNWYKRGESRYPRHIASSKGVVTLSLFASSLNNY